MEIISGGVTAPIGFLAAGMHAGVRKNKKKKDMALLVSKCPARTAGVFTQNVVKAAPVMWDKALCDNKGLCQALVVNSGVANACTGEAGDVDVVHMAELAAAELQVPADQVAVASTGVIGIRLPMETIAHGIRELSGMLSDDLESGSHAAEAIMTTDVYKKEIAVKLQIKGKTITVGGMCKGSGMINPNLGTVLGFLTTDLNISQELLQKTLRNDVIDTYNMLSVDGDTSTNDTVMIFANGMAGNDELLETDADYPAFVEALRYINTYFVKLIAADGEGTTRMFQVQVAGAESKEGARKLAKSVVTSNLVKCAYTARMRTGDVWCARWDRAGSHLIHIR
ncbi:bifunctional ornithine acetyltransferase/N-acetylglutamate synthase [Clostridium sp. AM54-14XD]|uniref:bifunctional ornithine acetyltransferase/N-acetylglutamate synthase n=1 Tax=Clostridium sp. AM54-14XD TaxID=2293037 RepID=UPI0026AD1DEB